MCIIAAKPAGTPMPAATTIENMWARNHDGAGFMYAHGGTVHIEKGFMKLADFNAALARVGRTVDLDDVSVVMHFRIATHGAVIPANTHPFPVTTSVGTLQKLKCDTTLGVAHNGIISSVTPRKGISDTMEYIVSQLGPLYKGAPTFYENAHLMQMIDNAVESKLALLTSKGTIHTIGKFEIDDGIMYSNTSYKPYTFSGVYWNSEWSDYYLNSDDFFRTEKLGYTFDHTRRLRCLWGDEATAIDGHGKLLDSYEDGFAVDSDGKLYIYKYECDGFVLVPGGYAHDSSGTTLRLEEDAGYTWEDVYEEIPPIQTYTYKPKRSRKKGKKAKSKPTTDAAPF